MSERQVLVNLGFTVLRTIDSVAYRKTYQSAGMRFGIELDTTSVSCGQLPEAKLISFPEQLMGQAVPHISGNRFCYVDGETLSWNPLDVVETLELVDALIQRTVDVIASGEWDGEYNGEFINYWCGNTPLFLLSKSTDKNASLLCRELVTTDLLGKPQTELVVSSNSDLFNHWSRARDGLYTDATYPAVAIRVSPWMPLGSNWPPTSFKDLMQWLKMCDHNAHNVLTDRIAAKLRGTKKTKILCLVTTGTDGDFGWVLHYEQNVVNFFNTMRRGISTKIASQRLTSKLWLKKMERVSVQLADQEFITTRNLPKDSNSLAGLRIALIGAGTIGGFTAKMLVDAGAGSVSGSLTIFDSDELSTANLGRHILPAQFVGRFKSSALSHYLKSIIPFSVDVKAQPDWSMKKNSVAEYDLVIDATGREPLSLLLADSFHLLKACRPQNSTMLVHVWIDGAGHLVRGLLDTGRSDQACYGCINEKSHPVFSSQNSQERKAFRQRCGSTYTPYPSGTSQAAASLAQKLALESLNERPSITYQQFAITDKPKSKRPMKLKKARICRISTHA